MKRASGRTRRVALLLVDRRTVVIVVAAVLGTTRATEGKNACSDAERVRVIPWVMNLSAELRAQVHSGR